MTGRRKPICVPICVCVCDLKRLDNLNKNVNEIVHIVSENIIGAHNFGSIYIAIFDISLLLLVKLSFIFYCSLYSYSYSKYRLAIVFALKGNRKKFSVTFLYRLLE